MTNSPILKIPAWLSHMYCEVVQILPNGMRASTNTYALRGDLPHGYAAEPVDNRIFGHAKYAEVPKFQGSK